MRKSYLGVIHVIAAAVVLPFVMLAAYAHPFFDDYGTALEIKRTGFTYYFTSLYQNWTGRYAFLLANMVHPLRFGGLRAYQCTAGGLVVGLVGSCCGLGWSLTTGTLAGHYRRFGGRASPASDASHVVLLRYRPQRRLMGKPVLGSLLR